MQGNYSILSDILGCIMWAVFAIGVGAPVASAAVVLAYVAGVISGVILGG